MNQVAYRREEPEFRKIALMEACLNVVSSQGVARASIRSIAAEAGVTSGLIRHYFASKDALIAAAFEHHMMGMIQEAQAHIREEKAEVACARTALARFVTATLSPPSVGIHSVTLWAGFMSEITHMEGIRETHRKTYLAYRDCLEALIARTMMEAGREDDASEAQRLAILTNAVLDGLWLEGSLLPRDLPPDHLPHLGLEAVGRLCQMDLKREGDET